MIRKKISLAAAYAVLVLGGLVMVYPLVFMAMASLFTSQDYFSTGMTLFPITDNPTLSNLLFFTKDAAYANLGVYLKNSVLRTAVYTAGTLLSTLVCGYAFSRLRFPGRKFIFFGLLFLSMMPATMTLIPQYLMYARWPLAGEDGILNTWLVYYIGLPAINIMGTFFVKQYIDTIPTAMDQAAKVDGANTLVIIFRILMPVMKPAIAYISITTALGIWNDWNTGFFFTDADSLQMLPSMISKIAAQGSGGAIPDYPQMLALGLVMTVPSLIIYAVFQKDIVACVATAGLKD